MGTTGLRCVCVCACLCVHIYIYICVCVYICALICINVCVCIYVCIYKYIYMCVYVREKEGHVYVFNTMIDSCTIPHAHTYTTYTHTHTHTGQQRLEDRLPLHQRGLLCSGIDRYYTDVRIHGRLRVPEGKCVCVFCV
jgi:hypothetical protein